VKPGETSQVQEALPVVAAGGCGEFVADVLGERIGDRSAQLFRTAFALSAPSPRVHAGQADHDARERNVSPSIACAGRGTVSAGADHVSAVAVATIAMAGEIRQIPHAISGPPVI
jgi:hypothetical protein